MDNLQLRDNRQMTKHTFGFKDICKFLDFKTILVGIFHCLLQLESRGIYVYVCIFVSVCVCVCVCV